MKLCLPAYPVYPEQQRREFNRRGFFATIIGIGIILLLIIAGFLLYKLKVNQKWYRHYSIVVGSPKPAPQYFYSPNADSVFKESFSFSHPSYLNITKISEINTTKTSGLPELVITEKPISSIDQLNTITSCVKIFIAKGYTNINEAVDQIGGGTFNTLKKPYVHTSGTTKISGIDGLERTVEQWGESQVTDEAIVQKGESFYYFRDCSSRDMNLFSRIIGSFKFSN